MNKKIILPIGVVGSIISAGVAVSVVLSATGVAPLLNQEKVDCEFRNYDDSYLWDSSISLGSGIVYEGATPSRPDDSRYTYTFTGWDKSLDSVAEDTIFYAQYYQQLREYTVTFVNYNMEELYVDHVAAGHTAVYGGETPTRPNDDKLRYFFKGWDVSLDNILENTTVKALYDSQALEHAVTFKNWDEKILYVDYVTYGETAEYVGLDPVKKSNSSFDYVFIGWDKDLTNVTKDFETTATFEEKPIDFTVTFQNFDGTELYVDYVSSGGTADYFGPTPLRPSSNQYTYAFSGWNKPLTNVTGDMVCTAKFQSVIRQYSVTFRNYDNTLLEQKNIDYGSTAVYTGETPTRPDDEKYTYTFSGWDRDLSSVTEDIITLPLFDRELRTFLVVFLNYDGAFVYSQEVKYGYTAVFLGETPVKPSDSAGSYKFVGWDKELTNITEDTQTVAQYELVESTGGGGAQTVYYVQFVNYDETLLDGDIVNPGMAAVYHGNRTPSRAYDSSVNRYFYFSSWDKAAELNEVNRDMITYAQYTTNYGEFIVSFRNIKGELIYEDLVNRGNDAAYEGPLYDYLKTENKFAGWSKPLTNITESITVFPTWDYTV